MSGYGDVRDLLVTLPVNPWGGYEGSYVVSNIFPAKHEILRERVPDARSVFEFGALHGFFLVTALDALELYSIGWLDNESAVPGSNEGCRQNIQAWRETAGRDGAMAWPAYVSSASSYRELLLDEVYTWDVVHVDGDHSYHGCLIDLALALAMRPKLILVDDTIAHDEVRRATVDFCSQMGFVPEWVGTVNGFAIIRTESGHAASLLDDTAVVA